MRSLPVPTSLHIFRMEPLRGHAIMVIETRLVFNLVDSFFGGSGKSDIKIEGRDFTPIEHRITKRVVEMILSDLEKAWRPVHEINLVYHPLRDKPPVRRHRPAHRRGPGRQVRPGNGAGRRHGHHVHALRHHRADQEQALRGFQSDQLEVDYTWMNRFKEQLMDAEVKITVQLGTARITGKQLLSLRVGDTIQLEQDAHDDVLALVEGVPKFKGVPGVVDGNQAVKVTQKIVNPLTGSNQSWPTNGMTAKASKATPVS